ncbi:hypothetical protein Pmani_013760 [Petrolisthes manimaculis]|uniref:Transposase n=1 Tax=Petrolisthes manimaculis TaxID=1843537 RepID=A0AAE1PXR1_9EUCA|nr:hypothetical protein Pmani_013760 [Petrolisthes manimaculis]
MVCLVISTEVTNHKPVSLWEIANHNVSKGIEATTERLTNKTPSRLSRAKRPRPRVTTPEEDVRIRRAPTETRFTTATAIREALNLNVSATTVCRRLHEAGIHHRAPATKERLTAAHRAGRLAFANQYVGHDLDFWSRVVFTDEKTFNSFNHGRLHVWRENNTRHGMGDVTKIEGKFTAAAYIDILEKKFIPSLQENNYPFPPDPIIFVQDRCPVHTARIVKDWFADQQNIQLLELPYIQLLELPSKGCDCNPIEHIWANMVNTWEPELERTGEQLMAHTQRQWELFRARPQEVRNLVSSMPDRLKAVIDAEGGWTHY